MRKPVAPLTIAILLSAWAMVASATPRVLEPNRSYNFAPNTNRECFFNELRGVGGRAAVIRGGTCSFGGGELKLKLNVTAGVGLALADFGFRSKVVVEQFRVVAGGEDSTSRFIPVHVKIPVAWSGTLLNSAKLEGLAEARSTMFFRLRRGNANNAGDQTGVLVSENPFQGASHAGTSCYSTGSDLLAAGELLINCVAGLDVEDEGSAVVELSAVIETGVVYNLELVLQGEVLSFSAVSPQTNYFITRLNGSERGLFWTGPAVMTLGADPVAGLEDLENQIAELTEQVERLRSDLEGHQHAYLTGRGTGHNNTEALTDAPLLPDPPAPVADSGARPVERADDGGQVAAVGGGGAGGSSSSSCGLGFELVFLLPALLAAQKARRSRYVGGSCGYRRERRNNKPSFRRRR